MVPRDPGSKNKRFSIFEGNFQQYLVIFPHDLVGNDRCPMWSDIDQFGSGIFSFHELPCFDHQLNILSKVTRVRSLVLDEMISRKNRYLFNRLITSFSV
jgi:hypothetical protein